MSVKIYFPEYESKLKKKLKYTLRIVVTYCNAIFIKSFCILS